MSYLLGSEDIHQQIFESAPTGNPDDLEDFTGDYSEPEWLYDITIGLTRDKHAVYLSSRRQIWWLYREIPKYGRPS